MKSERPYLDYLEDILDAIQKVREFILGMTYEEFAQDAKTRFAVTRAGDHRRGHKTNSTIRKEEISRHPLARHGWDA